MGIAYKNRRELLRTLKRWVKKGEVYDVTERDDQLILKKHKKGIFEFADSAKKDTMTLDEIADEIYRIRKAL